MATQGKLSAAELETILERIKALADQPVPEVNFDFDALDIAFDDLCSLSLASPVKAPTTATPAPSLSGTWPICIRVPARVIQAFKAQAAKTGGSYQANMNRVLSVAAAGFV